MEKLAASILFPCKYALTGCTETFHYTVKAEHESVCEHRWVGFTDFVLHLLLSSVSASLTRNVKLYLPPFLN